LRFQNGKEAGTPPSFFVNADNKGVIVTGVANADSKDLEHRDPSPAMLAWDRNSSWKV
jgi:hypothetical protein